MPVADLLTTLVPLIVGSAVLPVQITVTILLLRSPSGVRAGTAWVAGMTVVRLTQGAVFGWVLETATDQATDAGGPGPIVSTLLLVIALLFLLSAAKQLVREPPEDAPPPAWMDRLSSATPGRALAAGVGVVALSPKLWAFTLGAIAAIADAGVGPGQSAVAFLVFVALAESVHLSLVGLAAASPARSEVLLARVATGLERYNRPMMIGLGLVFGAWFLVKALVGLGVI